MKAKDSQREQEFDIAKGIGILMVALGHCITKEYATQSTILFWLRTILYMVHMPLFFMVAGYLYEEKTKIYHQKSILNFLKGKAKVFLIPYATFSCLIYMISVISTEIPKLAGIMERAGYVYSGFLKTILQIITYSGHLDGHLWFCYVMFLVLAFAFLVDYVVSVRVQFLIATVLYFIANLWLANNGAPEVLWRTAIYYFYFTCARLLSKKMRNGSWKRIIILSAFFLISTAVKMMCFTGKMSFLRYVIEMIMGIFGSLLIVSISIILIKEIAGSVLKKIGRESYLIYLVHQPYIVLGIEILLNSIAIPSVLIIAIAFIGSIVIPMLLNYCLISHSSLLKLLCLGGHQ